MTWEEQFDQLQEQSLLFSGWQVACVGAGEEQVLSSNLTLPCDATSTMLGMFLHLHIALCGLQILQKPEITCIPNYLPVQAAFSI